MKKIVTIALALVLLGVSMVVVGFFNGAVTYFTSDDFEHKIESVQDIARRGRWGAVDALDDLDDWDALDDWDDLDDIDIIDTMDTMDTMDASEGKEEHLVFSSEIRRLELDLEAYGVDLIAADAGDLTVTYTTFSKDLEKVVRGLNVRERGGVLYLEEFNRSKRTFANPEKHRVTIQVPKGQLDTIDIEASLSSVNLEGFDLRKLNIDNECSAIMVKDCQWDQGDLSAELGRIQIVDSNVKQTSISTELGEISVDNCVLESSSLETEMGSITGDLRFVRALELDLEMGSADLSFNQPRSEVEIRGKDGGLSGVYIDGEGLHGKTGRADHVLTIDKEVGRVDLSFQ